MGQITEFEHLIAEVAAGSEEAICQLAETYTPYIIRAVRLSLPHKFRHKFDSNDIAQTLWASILLGGTDITKLKSPERLIAYLARAAKYKVIDKGRRLNTQKCNIAREEPLDERPPQYSRRSNRHSKALYSRDPTPSTSISVRERWHHIVSNASERDKQILNMCLNGCGFDKIGLEVQVSAKTARRAIERLVEQLSQ